MSWESALAQLGLAPEGTSAVASAGASTPALNISPSEISAGWAKALELMGLMPSEDETDSPIINLAPEDEVEPGIIRSGGGSMAGPYPYDAGIEGLSREEAKEVLRARIAQEITLRKFMPDRAMVDISNDYIALHALAEHAPHNVEASYSDEDFIPVR